MSIDTETGFIPSFDLGDRLRKAREHTGLGHSEFADEIGVSRNTVTNYERGHVVPRAIVMKMWAMRTGVPLKWLETGEVPGQGGGPGGGVSVVPPTGLEPATYGFEGSVVRLRNVA